MTLRFAALRVEQREDVPLYVFGVNGRVIHHFATVDGAERSKDGVLSGYQRDQVKSHIRQIRDYLLQDAALLPNAIVVAFNGGVSFVPNCGAIDSRWGTPGTLLVRLPERGEEKAGLIVDGQQRVAALAELPPSRQFPVVVVSFATPSIDLQREQFVLVNKTKPLPRDLLNELLPHIDATLPKPWERRRIAGSVVERLRWDRTSPFHGRVRGIGAQGEGCNISQAAIIRVIESSMRRGVLAHMYSQDGSGADIEGMERVVRTFFSAVKSVWPVAWAGNPRNSRLVHGAGIVAMGKLMDVVMKDIDCEATGSVDLVARQLKKLHDVCAWTEGRWNGLGCAWNELQNTSQDKRRLAEYLLSEYKRQ